ncbi:MAG: serine hydrolase [Verrucomicrobia bacterium]|nr:serine hydrolase [Verrucomicrobiota bacterium]MBV9644341.1 serine hydrolase [Verrucomicrobiota bacterium]
MAPVRELACTNNTVQPFTSFRPRSTIADNAGGSDQVVSETEKLCANLIAQDTVPGLALAVVFKDQVMFAAGFGVRDVNTKETVNADTMFQLSSLSKPIGSTARGNLSSKGKFNGSGHD